MVDVRPARSPVRRRRASPVRVLLALLCLLHGCAATAALVVCWRWGDTTTASYALGLSAFTWLVPSPVLALLAACALARWWRAGALLSLAAPVVVLALVWGPTAVPGRGAGAGARDLRVVTYNHTGLTPLEGVVRVARATHPDVLAVQEVSPQDAVRLGELLGTQYPHVAVPPDARTDSVVLSKLPVVEVRPVEGLPQQARRSSVVVLDDGGRRIAVVSVHLASPCVLCSAGADAGNPAGDTLRAARVRAGEAARYVEVARGLASEGMAVVVAGDLNSAELNEPLRVLTGAGLVDVHRAVGTGPQLTRGPGPGVARVDAVLVSGLVPVASAEGERGQSTHAPVIADLAWAAPPGG